MNRDEPPDPPDPFAREIAAVAPPTSGLEATRVRSALLDRMFAAAEAPVTLGPYRLDALLGQGGMGVVHAGVDRRGRRVALKTLKQPTPAALLRLKHEFRRVAELGHPNLASVHQLALDPGRRAWFIAMEYVPGVMWTAAPRDALRDVLGQLAAGVHALHRAGLLHRDLKPSNVLVTPDLRVKIVDFGLAQATGAADPRRDGTDGYLAPERRRGEPATTASDWFSVGVMLFEALAGRHPVDGLAPAAPFAPDLPDLEALCRDLLAEGPDNRPRGDAVLRRLGLAPTPAPPPPVFLGRARELAACERALAGTAGLLLLEGPSGAGKSTLLAHLVAARRRAGGVVLTGRCYAGESVPFKALDGVVDALIEHLLTCPPEQVAPLLSDETDAIARLFPTFACVRGAAAPPPAGEVPREARRRVVAALRRLLTGLAGERPLVLAIDDLQWGDADSARLLADLLAAPDPPPLILAATVRSDLRDCAFFRELDEAGLACPVHRVAADPLAPADARALALALLRAADPDLPDPDRRAAAIADESQGNPLFIEAMTQRRGDDPRGSLELALAARLAGLDAPARRALERLAVAGRPLPHDLALPDDGPAPLAHLRALRLVRPGSDCDTVETSHDRVRVAVLALLRPDQRRRHHRALADDLAAAPDPDPEELALHLHGADDLPAAAEAALRAAERAAAALAFARAADRYADALAWGTFPSAQVLEVSLARAAALVDAGRCAAAAPALLAAAALAPTRPEELALRGRAVEHYLVSGHVAEGLAVLRPLAHELGLPLAASDSGTLVQLALEFARLWLARRLPGRDDPVARLLADLCWSLGKGLGFIDPVRAAAFIAHGLRLALPGDDPRRVARADAFLALLGINSRRPAAAAAAATAIRSARRLADDLDDPALSGLATVLSGVAAMNNGRWRDSLAEVDAGAALLRARCLGVAWERGIAGAMAMHALLMLGDFPGLAARADAARRDAADAGDRFSAVVAVLYSGHVALADDDPARAREAVRKALSLWPYERFSFQHWLALGVEVGCDLLDARPHDALARVEAAWPQLAASRLMTMQIPRIDARMLRAGAALGVAAREPARADALLRRALREADALRRERIGLARAGEALVRAQVAFLRREPDAADRLAAAADRLARDDTPALAAAARLGLRRLGREPDPRPDDDLARRGVRAPARWAALVTPALS